MALDNDQNLKEKRFNMRDHYKPPKSAEVDDQWGTIPQNLDMCFFYCKHSKCLSRMAQTDGIHVWTKTFHYDGCLLIKISKWVRTLK